WWVDVTAPMIEMARIRLRGLVRLIDPGPRAAIYYTDFEDTAGDSAVVEIRAVTAGVDRARFREKALAFLRSHEDDAVLFKVRHGKQLTAVDLEQLEQIMVENGLDANQIRDAAATAHGLGLFVRSLVGLDRDAATEALSEFTAGTTLTGNQISFVNLLVEQLTQRGVIDAALLYEAPFTDVAPTGPDGLFASANVTQLIDVLERIRRSAEAS
ncbi:MAG: type I restriction-modification enzyme R subunit C-terminal domain-containing protein, partial [Rhodoglobus sp.]